jgi:serine/threonine protein kinase
MQRLSGRHLSDGEQRDPVEAARTRFASEWQQGETPDAALYLDRVSVDDRPVLLRELLLVEWHHLDQQGKTPDLRTYQQRFAALAAAVEDAWQQWRGRCGPAAQTQGPECWLTHRPAGPPPAELSDFQLSGYTDLVELGSGGMGVVYRARDEQLGRLVALKMIRKEALHAEALQRFRTEARALARLQHPHIVQVHGWEEPPGGQPVLVLEYVAGDSLERCLKGRRPTASEAARLVAILARAVQAAHAAGIVHRDLKPANVLMAAAVEGNAGTVLGGFPKVSDFGLARVQVDTQGKTASGLLLGTPAYMAPEQAAGRRDVGPAADVWALGVILYRCLTGQLPFEGDSVLETLERIKTVPVSPPRELVDVPAELEAICLRCLDKEPARRPGAAELAERLERFLAGEPPETVVWQPARGAVRARRFLLALGLGGVLLAAMLAWLLWPPGQRKGTEQEEPLKVKPLRVMHHARTPDGKESTSRGALGEKSFTTRFRDQVTIRVELSEPGHFYLIAFNADGGEQLLWPAGEDNKPLPDAVPDRQSRLHFPLGGQRFTLNDERQGGLQAFVVLASRRPLPPYAEWKRQRGPVPWVWHRPGKKVWQADDRGTYEVMPGEGADRGSIEPAPGAPPLERLCRALRVAGVEVVEAIAFPVQSLEAE